MKQLRPYQELAIDCVMSAKAHGVQSAMLVLATGLGKTITAINISKAFNRTLFIVDSEELADQAAKAFKYEYIETGLIKADKFDIKPVTIASIQTLHRRLDKIDPYQFDLVIVDECHGYLAKTYQKGVFHFLPQFRLGLTATPQRLDNLSLYDMFDRIAFEYNIKKGIEDGYLVELDAIRIKTNVSLDKVSTLAGEFNQGQLSNEINTLARNNTIADAYLKYANGRRTIVFCCSIQHAMDLCEAFISKGIKATAISADDSLTGDRTQKVQDFKDGKYDVIMNCSILGKGFDLPIVSCIIQASPTKSLTRYMQAVGRATRVLPGIIDGLGTAAERWAAIKKSDKKEALIIDITDNTTRHNLVNAWELDKELHPSERVFITEEKRKLLLETRLNKKVLLEHTQLEDEKVNLLKIPRIKINFNSDGMKKPATEKQIEWLRGIGFPVDENVYTMGMVQQIVGELPASRAKIEDAKRLGYDVENKVITNNQINAIQREVWLKANKRK